MIDYGFDLAKSYNVEIDISIFNKYKGEDNSFDKEELLKLSEIMKYEHKGEIVKKWLETYDENYDNLISEKEAKKLLIGYEIIKQISE
jgi:hypothetical protein